MKTRFYMSVILIGFLLSIQAVFSEGELEQTERSITVRGVGSFAAAPDTVRLNLGVQSMNKDLNAAIDDNNRRIKAVIEIIRAYKIPDTDFSTSNFSVYYQQPYNPESSPEDGIYNVNNNIFIELQDIDKIGSFIEQALSAGANQFYGLEYSIRDSEPLKKEARKLAIENALKLAEETASYANLSLGEIISIEEAPWYGGAMYAEGYGGMSNSNSLITVPGEKKIETQVTLVIELE